MSNLIYTVDDANEIVDTAQRLRDHVRRSELTPSDVIEVLERWGASLHGPALESIPGVAFLRLWLRRGTLEPIVIRELGSSALHGEWSDERGLRLRSLPAGVVGHWPAGNIEIQPLLSLSCSLLGCNAGLVRVPSGLREETRAIIEKLEEVDAAGVLTNRICFAMFDHERLDLQQAMAAAVDGAMIWGGAEAILQVRALPFPHWARMAVFGPRLSVAVMDGDCWTDEANCQNWCRRLARDVWQFDQQACSSPQALFLERRDGCNPAEFVATLAQALASENRAHPRHGIHPALTSAICLARASWLLDDPSHEAVFPATPDWTVLLGEGPDIPQPTQGRTLSVLLVDDLSQPIARFDGMVQTLGLAVKDAARESALAHAAGRHGVDRIVRLGRMHVFGSPWDGAELVKPMVRLVRHVPSNGGQT